jgi:Aldo/keto reductase family
VSELSLGGGPLGNMYRAIDDEQAHATVAAAWERGVRYFDTAPHYGIGGSSGPLTTGGDRRCPCGTVAARTQRGPSSAELA